MMLTNFKCYTFKQLLLGGIFNYLWNNVWGEYTSHRRVLAKFWYGFDFFWSILRHVGLNWNTDKDLIIYAKHCPSLIEEIRPVVFYKHFDTICLKFTGYRQHSELGNFHECCWVFNRVFDLFLPIVIRSKEANNFGNIFLPWENKIL